MNMSNFMRNNSAFPSLVNVSSFINSFTALNGATAAKQHAIAIGNGVSNFSGHSSVLMRNKLASGVTATVGAATSVITSDGGVQANDASGYANLQSLGALSADLEVKISGIDPITGDGVKFKRSLFIAKGVILQNEVIGVDFKSVALTTVAAPLFTVITDAGGKFRLRPTVTGIVAKNLNWNMSISDGIDS